jgi:3-isopropylmalate/(R)-2-methylmalate dehydratase small subunit
MKPFTTHRGIIAPLNRANVDTDQIIAKQFLKSIARTGFGPQLFYDWRYLADGKANPDFSLNLPRYQNASILVARNNFGCGSSREHAVWAIDQYGFRAVIAPWVQNGADRIPAFADIFRNNSFKNALVTIELSSTEVDQIFDAIEKNPGLESSVDVQKQTVTLHTKPNELSFHFELDAAIKERLLHGLDDIGLSLQNSSAITEFEKTHHGQMKW